MRQIPALPRRPEGVELSRTPSDCAPGVRPSPNPRGKEERKTQTAEDEGRAPIETPLSTNTRRVKDSWSSRSPHLRPTEGDGESDAGPYLSPAECGGSVWALWRPPTRAEERGRNEDEIDRQDEGD